MPDTSTATIPKISGASAIDLEALHTVLKRLAPLAGPYMQLALFTDSDEAFDAMRADVPHELHYRSEDVKKPYKVASFQIGTYPDMLHVSLHCPWDGAHRDVSQE